MTHENTQPNQPRFASQYPLPEDQLAFQMHLQDSYAQQFPESRQVMDEALADIQRASGMNIPKYKFQTRRVEGTPPDEEDPTAGGLNDEFGYLKMENPITQTLMLSMPVEHTPEQIAAMSPIEKTIASKTHHGNMVIGELSAETRSMLEGIYQLTGSQVVRDDRELGIQEGVVLREGEYQGSKVWLVENYFDSCPYYEGADVSAVRVVDEDSAKFILGQLTDAQRKQFSDQTGVWEARKIVGMGVDNTNYQQVAHVVGEAGKVVQAEVDREKNR